MDGGSHTRPYLVGAQHVVPCAVPGAVSVLPLSAAKA
jgi:hypothetical protein